MRREGYSPKTIRDKLQTVRGLALQLGTLLEGEFVCEMGDDSRIFRKMK